LLCRIRFNPRLSYSYRAVRIVVWISVERQVNMKRWACFATPLVALALVFFTGAPNAKADTLTPTSFVANTSATFSGVDVYFVDANSKANPWGLTSTCPVGCNVNPIGPDSSTPFTVENVTLRDTGATGGAGLDVTGGVFTVHLFGSSSIFATGTDSAPQISNTSGTTVSYSSSSDSFCALAACNNGADPAVPFTLKQVAPDVFTATSNSLEIVFSLSSSPTSTPEAPTAFLLGMGLLGFLGLGWGRQRKALTEVS
jgi:hypothetical protein